MDVLGSSLSHLRYKNLENLEPAEQETIKKEFSSLMWSEVLKSLEKCDEVIQSELSRSSNDQLTSLRYQMLAQKMGDQYPLDFSSIFPNKQPQSQELEPLTQQRITSPLPVNFEQSPSLSLTQDKETVPIMMKSDRGSLGPVQSDNLVFESPEHFIETLLPRIRQINPNESAVPSEAVLAQAALETGWGQKILGHSEEKPSYNLFNIKATAQKWSGPKIVKEALEVIDGGVEKIKSAFRSYSNFNESIKDYFDFIQGERYSDLLDKPNTPKEYIDKIAAKGYATDPAYAQKLGKVVQRIASTVYGGKGS